MFNQYLFDNVLALPPIPPRQTQGLDDGVHAALYLCGATSLRDFMQPLGVTAFKIGLTSRRDIQDRVVDLRERRYAAIVADLADRNATILDHPLGQEWFLSPMPDPTGDPQARARLAELPQSEFTDRVVSFRVPPGIQLASLEKGLQYFLQDRNLNAYLDSDDGQTRLRETGLPPTTRLFTDYDLMGRPRRSLATEIFCVRPKKEVVVLLTALVLALRRERAAVAASRLAIGSGAAHIGQPIVHEAKAFAIR
jgi:hypothetical protein